MIVYLEFPQADNIEFVEVNVNNYNATIPVFGTYNFGLCLSLCCCSCV